MLENISFLDIFDAGRVLLGAISAEVVFMERAAEHREHFLRRVMVSVWESWDLFSFASPCTGFAAIVSVGGLQLLLPLHGG